MTVRVVLPFLTVAVALFAFQVIESAPASSEKLLRGTYVTDRMMTDSSLRISFPSRVTRTGADPSGKSYPTPAAAALVIIKLAPMIRATNSTPRRETVFFIVAFVKRFTSCFFFRGRGVVSAVDALIIQETVTGGKTQIQEKEEEGSLISVGWKVFW